MTSEIQIGLTGENHRLVTADLTAQHMGSGDLLVFATPALIALMEGAAVNTISPHLSPEQTSVGVSIEVKHLAATPLGHQVRATAEVISVEGRQITFRVQACDEQELIGEGTHQRVVVDRERFLRKLKQKPNKQ